MFRIKIRSSISNPRSAITESPLSNKSKIPLCLVNALSDMLPGTKDETKVVVPSGEIPMRALKVLCYHSCNSRKSFVVTLVSEVALCIFL